MIDVINLTQALVRCPSVTPANAGAQDELIKVLEPLGFICTRLKFGSVDNLFARRGMTGPHLCFAGHTDVVPPGQEGDWTYPPFSATLADGKIFGRGTADMKGNIAAFVAAISQFSSENLSLSLLITGDEEGPATEGTIKVLEWMAENHHIPDVCIVGEPTNPDKMGEEIKIGRRGSLSGTITLKGIQGHVAYPHLADNPIPKLAQMIDALSNVQFDNGSDHFGATHLEIVNISVGNMADNIIPGQASARFNIRFNDLWTPQTLEKRLRGSLDDITPSYELSLTCGAMSFITMPGPLTTLVAEAVKAVTGLMPALSTSGGTSDARFIHHYCPVVECGLTNKTIHKIDEHVAIGDLKILQAIYGEILQRYASLPARA